MSSALKFLIIAGPYEADLIRRAAVAAAVEAIAIEAGDSLSGWVSAARPDAIVVTSRAVKAAVKDTVDALRSLPGGNVPIVMLCDAVEQAEAEAAADQAFVRPASPQAVVQAAQALVQHRRASQVPPPAVASGLDDAGSSPQTTASDFEKAQSSATRRAPSEPRLRTLSSEPTALHGLAPLMVERRRSPSGAPSSQPLPAPFARRISDSIDKMIDAEMERTLSTVGPLPQAKRERQDEQTREVPSDFVNTILAEARHVLASASPLPGMARVGKRAGFPAAGELGQTSVASLLGLALQEGITGRLRVRHADAEKSVFFEAGRPVLAVSSAVADRMVQMLVRQGTVSNEQAKTAIDMATQTGRRMGAVLVDLGFIKSTELLPAVRQHYEEIIFSLFAWTEGGFRFEAGATADPRRVRLLRHPSALVMEGVSRAYDEARLLSEMGRDTEVLRLESGVSAPDILLEVSAGDPGVSRVPVLFDGVRLISEVIRASAQPRVTVLQVALVLRAFGLLVPVRSGESLPPAADAVASRDREIDRERIAARAALVQEGDYFQVLGVPPTSGTAEIKLAHERISRELSAAAVGAELAKELEVSLEDIRGVVDEAFMVLADDRLRAAYVLSNEP